MSETIQRYELETEYGGVMVPDDSNGQYVLFSDALVMEERIKALEAENAELKTKTERLNRICLSHEDIEKELIPHVERVEGENAKLRAVAEAALVAFEEDDNDSGMLAQTHHNLEQALQAAGYNGEGE